MMKNSKPMLYSPPMVRAIIEDRKVITRRIIKPQPDQDPDYEGPEFIPCVLGNEYDHGKMFWDTEEGERIVVNPPFVPGMILWVKESHYRRGYWNKDGKTRTGKQKWVFIASDNIITYNNNPPVLFERSRNKDYPHKVMWYKRSSLFMPEMAARIFLQIVKVKVERLHDITEVDAHNEGVEFWDKDGFFYKDYITNTNGCVSAQDSFESLWISINGKDSWKQNPWVWVVEFKRITKPTTI